VQFLYIAESANQSVKPAMTAEVAYRSIQLVHIDHINTLVVESNALTSDLMHIGYLVALTTALNRSWLPYIRPVSLSFLIVSRVFPS